jgi:hypothetical protein
MMTRLMPDRGGESGGRTGAESFDETEAASRIRSSVSASPATVGVSNRVPSRRLMSNIRLMREISCTANIESPPNSMKLSWTPSLMPSNFSQSEAIFFSVSLRGAT